MMYALCVFAFRQLGSQHRLPLLALLCGSINNKCTSQSRTGHHRQVTSDCPVMPYRSSAVLHHGLQVKSRAVYSFHVNFYGEITGPPCRIEPKAFVEKPVVLSPSSIFD